MKHAIALLILSPTFSILSCHAAWDHNKLGMVLWLLAAAFSGFWGCIGFAIETHHVWKGRDYYRKD